MSDALHIVERAFGRVPLADRIAQAKEHMTRYRQHSQALWPYQPFSLTVGELLEAAEHGLKAAAEITRLRAALSAQPAAVPDGWALETGVGGFSEKGDRWACVRHLESQRGQDFYEDNDPLIFAFLSAIAAAPQAPQQDEAQNAKGEEHGPEEATEAPARLHRSSQEPGAVGGGDQLA